MKIDSKNLGLVTKKYNEYFFLPLIIKKNYTRY